ncbi:MAG: response regulator transcription factor [Cyanobacteria bacterium REEB65]|nr:response regulator transcription factor [Cyanobacteria bacterium REEB65]
MNANILVVEDEPNVRVLLEVLLTKEGYKVFSATNGEEALSVIDSARPDLIVTDIMMSKMDGFELCRRIRKQATFDPVPILMLTAKGEPVDKYQGFSAGADDYLTKPFDPVELLFRVKAHLRRSHPSQRPSPTILQVGPLTLDCANYEIQIGDRKTLLTRSEYALIHYLMTHHDQVIASRKLLSEALGYPPHVGSSDLIRTHVRNIRKKIEVDPANPIFLLNVSRHGYTIKS